MKIYVFSLLLIGLSSFLVSSNALLVNPKEEDSDEERIVGGRAIDIETAKHQVSIRLKIRDLRSFGNGHLCGGSLITVQLVLSAAHCFFYDTRMLDAEDLIVVGGNSIKTNKDKYTEIFNIQDIIVHEWYMPNEYGHDIALMKMVKPVRSDHPRLKPIALAKKTAVPGTDCRVSGWGKLNEAARKQTNKLMAVNVFIIHRDECRASYGFQIKQGMICAGVPLGGKDACQGDSGGPLVCSGRLQGVVSFGKGCGLAEYPGVYTNVAEYQHWIKQNGKLLVGSHVYRNSAANTGVKIVTNLLVFIQILYFKYILKISF